MISYHLKCSTLCIIIITLKYGSVINMKSPLITMSAITGKPNKEKIFEYLKGLKDNGIEQVMLYPRSGCEIEYLSEDWFNTIANFIEAAKSLDMCIWLYDDFNWPSGDACGRVTAIPEYRLKSIVTKGNSIGTIGYKSRHNSGIFGEKYFPNLLSYDAVNYFIKCTHEEYYKRFGKYFGTIVKGMFTDEPSIGYCCEGNSIPYYDGIEADYNKFCGRDFNRDMLSQYENFYLNAITVISNRFNECYISKIASWCEEHRILMTGHLMCDNEPFWTTKHNGRLLKNLSGFSLPGIDEISTDLADRSEMALFGAIEYAKSDNGAMAELFALGSCDMSYGKRRAMLYLSACFKINHYFLAISHLDMRGNMLVTDFFNNFNIDQPDFSGMRLLSEEAKKAGEYAKKDFTADVYIRYPFSVSAKNITKDLDLAKFFDLINELTYKQIQWKFIDNEEVADAPIIELNDRLEFTIDKKPFDISLINGNTIVTNENGDTPDGIFVRRFNDDSIVILNLFAPKGTYLINGKDVYLDEYDVLLTCSKNEYRKKEILTVFNVSYCNDNMIRTMHINSQENAEIYCNSDIFVNFAVRNGVNAYLNGEKIDCYKDANILSSGMRDLYKISDTVSLKRCVNIIKSENDFKYMPSVFIAGDFSCEIISGDICRLNLKRRKNTFTCGDTLSDYGKIELTADVIVPFSAKSIEIKGTQLYTLLYCNSILMGEKIASPYIFDIDESLWNKKIILKIVQYSSLAPIFGDVDYWDKNAKISQWRGTPSPKQTLFGFKEINWIF